MKQAGDNVYDSSRVDIVEPNGKVSYVRPTPVDIDVVALPSGYTCRSHVVDLKKKGNDLTGLPVDLRIRENLPMPLSHPRA
jgi:hypothetical protein